MIGPPATRSGAWTGGAEQEPLLVHARQHGRHSSVRASHGEQILHGGEVGVPIELTPQELQVAALVRQGLSNREVASQLFLSPRTIDFHLRNVFTKLGISSRTELAGIDLD